MYSYDIPSGSLVNYFLKFYANERVGITLSSEDETGIEVIDIENGKIRHITTYDITRILISNREER